MRVCGKLVRSLTKKWNLYGYRNYTNSIDKWSMENWFAALQKNGIFMAIENIATQ
jgi:hypothetical protein